MSIGVGCRYHSALSLLGRTPNSISQRSPRPHCWVKKGPTSKGRGEGKEKGKDEEGIKEMRRREREKGEEKGEK